jgi:hypothetical protein
MRADVDAVEGDTPVGEHSAHPLVNLCEARFVEIAAADTGLVGHDQQTKPHSR